MKAATLLTTDLVFILAWVFPLLMVLIHRARSIPRRLDEIEEVFLGPKANGPIKDLRATPGCPYLKLFRSLTFQHTWTRESVMVLFRQQYSAWHSWGRYLLPLAFIAVISAVELKFCRDWMAVQLDLPAQRLTTATVAADREGSSSGGSGTESAPRVIPTRSAMAGDSLTRAGSTATSPSSTPPNVGGPPAVGSAMRGFPTIRTPTAEQLAGVPDSIILALLGGLVWSTYEILARRYSRDLTPQELLQITFRLIASVPIGYAFANLAAGTWNAPLAFVASAFPIRELRRFIRERALASSASVPGSEKLPTAHLGQVLDGISTETATRLEELNITTSWELAYADPVGLMARTGYSLRLILAWMDQALMTVYFDGKTPTLRNLAIPCALDLCEFFEAHCWDQSTAKYKPCSEDPAVKDLAQRLDIPASILPERLHALHRDPHVRFLVGTWYTADTPESSLLAARVGRA